MNVSVIIPTYNRADTVKRAIESVLDQTYDTLEIIVVDDGSTDGTDAVIDTIKDERLRYIKLDENKGVSNARNVGVAAAGYDMIAFQDSDDVWRKNKLEKQIKKFEEYPDSSLVYCAYDFHNSEEVIRVPSPLYEAETLDGEIYACLLERNTVGAPTILMKKDIFDRIGGFDTTYPALEDWDLALKASVTGRISYVDEPLVDAYRTGGGVSSSFVNFYKARCRMIAEHADDMTKFGIFDRTVKELFERAGRNDALELVKKMLIVELAQKKGI